MKRLLKAIGYTLAIVMLCAFQTSVVFAGGNDFIVTDLRLDLPELAGSGDYFAYVSATEKPTGTHPGDFTTGWLSVDLDNQPGTYGTKFPQVGLITEFTVPMSTWNKPTKTVLTLIYLDGFSFGTHNIRNGGWGSMIGRRVSTRTLTTYTQQADRWESVIFAHNELIHYLCPSVLGGFRCNGLRVRMFMLTGWPARG
jgi:hypothetical protein